MQPEARGEDDCESPPTAPGMTEPQTEADQADAAEIAAEIAAELQADACQQRLWLKSITGLIQLRSHDPDPSDRVQLACDLMTIAACERAARILRSDLPADRG